MPVLRKTLSVVPNPWTFIDHKGLPAGVCLVEQPGGGSFLREWVGARVAKSLELSPEKRVVVGGRTHVAKYAVHHNMWEHDTEPVTVQNTAYYRKKVARGELLAADAVSAAECGISKKDFVDPKELLAQLREAAIKRFDLENGEGAFELLAEQHEEDEARRQEVADAIAAEAEGGEDKPAPTPEAAPSSAPPADAKSDTRAKVAAVRAREVPAAAPPPASPPNPTTPTKGSDQ